MIVFSTTLIYLFKFFTGHWQKPLCGRISDGWRKRRKWKLNCFHFPPPPYTSCFLLFFWPRARMTAVFNFDNVEDNTTYYTHYIRWIIEPKSKQKTTCYYNIQQKLKNEMKKPDVCLEEKTKKRIAKKKFWFLSKKSAIGVSIYNQWILFTTW